MGEPKDNYIVYYKINIVKGLCPQVSYPQGKLSKNCQKIFEKLKKLYCKKENSQTRTFSAVRNLIKKDKLNSKKNDA